MSTTDAFVWLTCDACGEQEEVTLPFVYQSMSGGGGHYDHRNPRLPEGWRQVGDDEHYCETCADRPGMSA